MTKNVGSIDRIVRIVVGLLLAAYALFMRGLDGLGWLALVVGAVLVVTALMNWCPLYRVLGINTNKG